MPIKQLTGNRKIAIVGGGPTRLSAPFADPSWEIWAFSSRNWEYPRVTRWFELHAIEDLRSQLTEPRKGRRTFADYMRYLKGLRCPLYMQERHPEFPTSVAFPLKDALDAFGRCFTSTASYMVALAILEGAGVIGLWGINPTSRSYAYQRSTLEYLLGRAVKRGIEVQLPEGLPLEVTADSKFVSTPVLYAWDWRSPGAWWVKRSDKPSNEHGSDERRKGVQETSLVSKSRNRARRVFAVQDHTTQRWIAIKENSKVAEAQEEFRAMQSYRDFTHLVRAERFFVRDGKGCIAMEWLSGPTLRETIRRGSVAPAKAASIALNILAGLKELHRAGFVHGDLHAGNVIVTDLDKGAVKIIDFQHAVPIGPSGRAEAKRKLASPPADLAPESNLGVIDVRYDLYGVGYMTAAMLLGREPEETLRRDALPRALAKKLGRPAGTLEVPDTPAVPVKRTVRGTLGKPIRKFLYTWLGIAPGNPPESPSGNSRGAAPAHPGGLDAETSAALRLWAVALKGADPDPEKRYPTADAMAEAIAAAVAPVK